MKQEDTRQMILTQALRLFSENGYDAVSVGEIAEAVGIKAPSLYNHFRSKQAIFDAVIEDTRRRYEDFTGQLSVHLSDMERDVREFTGITEDALADKVRQIFLFTLNDENVRRLRKMLTIEQFRSRELSELYTRRFVDSLTEYHAGLFRRLIETGELRGEDPGTLALMYTAPILTLTGVCDRQPELLGDCLSRLDAHVRLFYRTFRKRGIYHEADF